MLRNGLELSGSRRNADPLCEGHKLWQGPNLHFIHHPVTMGLDGTFGTAQFAGDLFVWVTANDKVEDFSLAWRLSPETGAHAVQFVLQIA